MAKPSVKKDAEVTLIAGAHKGKSGKVLELLADDRVIVEGINLRYRHIKPTAQNPKGGRIQKECPVHISNVMLKDRYDSKIAAKQA